MNNITFIPLGQTTGRRGLQKGTISVVHNTEVNKAYRVTLNRDMADELVNEGFVFVRFAINNLTGQTYLVFTKEYYSGAVHAKLGDKHGFRIQDKTLVCELTKRKNLKLNCKSILEITDNLSYKEDVKTYEIKGVINYD